MAPADALVAAIQGLHEVVRGKDAQMETLQSRIEELERKLAELDGDP